MIAPTLDQSHVVAPSANKSLRMTLVASALPPRLDGIGDYTALLSIELAQTSFVLNVGILSSNRTAADPLDGVTIRGVFDPDIPSSAYGLLDAIIEEKPDWVVLQYNPFSYGRRGLNLQLPRAMSQIKQRSPRTRLAIMFHETYVPLTRFNFAVMTTWQRWQFYQLGRAADVSDVFNRALGPVPPKVVSKQTYFSPTRRLKHSACEN